MTGRDVPLLVANHQEDRDESDHQRPTIVTSGWRTHAIARGTDGRLYANGTSWSGYTMLGTEQIEGDPVAVARGTDAVDLFVRGTDGRLYTKTFDGIGTRSSGCREARRQ